METSSNEGDIMEETPDNDREIETGELRSDKEEKGREFYGSATEMSMESTDYQTKHVIEKNNVPTPPNYSFENFREVAVFKNPAINNKYFIGCKWSPDGTCLLSNCADYTLRIIDLPQEFYSKQCFDQNDNSILNLKTSLEVSEGGLVYDYDWYPFMSSWDPSTCCFIASSHSSPIHLWDAYTGKIRASYRAYDFADELHTALSLCFSTSGEDIYCGFNNFVKVFDVSKPGRDCENFNLKELGDQKGLVSCICENPTVPELFAAGTYKKTIGLYTRSNEFVCLLTGQKSGLTHIKFTDDGLKLFSGARKDNEIICWDIRNPGTVLLSLKRVVDTNQRIYFDITKDNRYLISGGTDGNLRFWDISRDLNVTDYELKNLHILKAHNDCVNGVSIHCRYPLVATSSGQQHRLDLTNDEEDNVFFYDKTNEKAANYIKLWWVGPLTSSQGMMEL